MHKLSVVDEKLLKLLSRKKTSLKTFFLKISLRSHEENNLIGLLLRLVLTEYSRQDRLFKKKHSHNLLKG